MQSSEKPRKASVRFGPGATTNAKVSGPAGAKRETTPGTASSVFALLLDSGSDSSHLPQGAFSRRKSSTKSLPQSTAALTALLEGLLRPDDLGLGPAAGDVNAENLGAANADDAAVVAAALGNDFSSLLSHNSRSTRRRRDLMTRMMDSARQHKVAALELGHCDVGAALEARMNRKSRSRHTSSTASLASSSLASSVASLPTSPNLSRKSSRRNSVVSSPAQSSLQKALATSAQNAVANEMPTLLEISNGSSSSSNSSSRTNLLPIIVQTDAKLVEAAKKENFRDDREIVYFGIGDLLAAASENGARVISPSTRPQRTWRPPLVLRAAASPLSAAAVYGINCENSRPVSPTAESIRRRKETEGPCQNMRLPGI